MPAKRKNYVVTTFGTDGACAAAMVLLAHPEAAVCVTSTSRAAEALTDLRKAASKGSEIHVCGLGVTEPEGQLFAVLDNLRASGMTLRWYCGRGYLDDVAAELSAHCETVLTSCGSNTEAVYRHLALHKSKQADLLLDLAAEFVDKAEDLPEDHQWWQDYVQAAAARHFKYGDDDAFPALIQKLAGHEPVTAMDEREVTRWRRAGGSTLPLGNSPAMKRLRSLVLRLAPVDEPVLVCGPSGSGKEVVARLLHEASPRVDGPFVPVNCAILSTSSDLAHDRLFGHKAGAYTGAKEDGKGAFEMADDGTLFLDEVAELPLDVQTQLLRVLEEGTVLPLGTMVPTPVNVRVVAATNRDLQAMIEAGKFRLDLFYRLNVLSLRVPPLRDRREDMKSIANAVIHDLKDRGYALTLTKADWDVISACSWPGNIRQFRNILKRAAYMKISVGEALAEEACCQVPLGLHGDAMSGTVMPHLELFWPLDRDAITPEDEVRRAYMRRCFELCEGNWTQTAQKLGVAVNTLRKWVEPRRRTS